MWPDASDKWFDEWRADAVLHVKGRLQPFPVLRGFADRIAANAVARSREVAEYLRQYDDYFESSKPYGRWLRGLSYREALRLVLQPEPVEAILHSLAAPARWHLRLRYIDQLSDDDAAMVLDLRSEGRELFDAARVRTESFKAYSELLQALERRTPAVGGVRPAALFPLFPNTTRDAQSRSTPRGQT